MQTPPEHVTLTVALVEIVSAAHTGTADKASTVAADTKILMTMGRLQNMPLR